jgi:ABC-2 type transport system permease protein
MTGINFRGGWALVNHTWASWLQYRGFFFVLAFGWMIPPLVYLFVWSTAAGQPGGLAGAHGLSRGDFVAYYLVLILVNQLTYAQTNWTVGDMIREGLLSTWLLRPLPALYHVLASELAGKVVYMVFIVPVSALLAVWLRPELHTNWLNGGLFVLALLLAWGLRFFWGYGLALLAFWAARADALLAVQDTLVFLLAGMVAPVSLLPPVMQTTARLLPFWYMVGFPVEIVTGHLRPGEILSGLALQLVWLAVAVSLSTLAWQRGLRRYSAVGG